MPRIPDALANSVAFLYPNTDAARSETPAGGTAFALAIDPEDDGPPHEYLVSNIHLVCQGCRTLRVRTDSGFDCHEIAAASWTTHPDGDDVAIASIRSDELGVTAIKWSALAATQERLAELNVGVGDEVFMLGRFIAHEGKTRQQPLARFGNIALMPDPSNPVLDGRSLERELFLVEMRSLSGYSGSPVFLYVGPATYRGDGRMMPFYSENIGLIGVDTGHKINRVGIDTKGTRCPAPGDWTVTQNTGIALVAPVWKIADLLFDAEEVKARRATEARRTRSATSPRTGTGSLRQDQSGRP
ncbi:hypothetical protein [Microbacterium sp.]|uniref:hypothetical protein n=1 Tax=Microbacterium sp. TaxID=51671 RepID=UPI0027368B63|nr:hypothetical protein [Microbacterium sp.]MDP3950529.1 hypothetical protein [Microbacterium sp.]